MTVRPSLRVEVAQDLHHPARRDRVERGHRLVGQDDLGLLHQGAGDGAALLLAAGERVGPLGGVVGQTPKRCRAAMAACLVSAGHRPKQAPPEGDAAQRAQRHVGEQATAGPPG